MENTILNVSLKEYKKAIDDLRASLLGLDEDSEEYKKTVKEIADMQTKLDKVMKDTSKQVLAQEGSYNRLTQEMSRLKKIWKETADEGKRNEIGKQIKDINDKLKGMDASIGNYQRSVGDYANAWTDAFSKAGGALGSVGSSAAGAVGGIKNVGAAFKALRASMGWIGILIGTIVAAFSALAKGISSSEENTRRFQKVLAPFKAIMDEVSDVLTEVADGFLSMVDNINLAIDAYDRWYHSLPDFAQYLVNPLQKTVEEIGDLTGLTDKYNEKLKIENSILQLQNKLTDDSRKSKKELAILNREESEQLATMSNRTLSYAERQQALEKAFEAKNKQTEINLKLARQELELMQKQSEATANDAETNDKLAEAEARVIQLEGEMAKNRREYNQQSKSLAKDAKSLEKEQVESLKDYYELVMKNNESTTAAYANAARSLNDLNKSAAIDELKEKVKQAGNEFDGWKTKVDNLDKQIAVWEEHLRKIPLASVGVRAPIEENIKELEAAKDKIMPYYKESEAEFNKVTEQTSKHIAELNKFYAKQLADTLKDYNVYKTYGKDLEIVDKDLEKEKKLFGENSVQVKKLLSQKYENIVNKIKETIPKTKGATKEMWEEILKEYKEASKKLDEEIAKQTYSEQKQRIDSNAKLIKNEKEKTQYLLTEYAKLVNVTTDMTAQFTTQNKNGKSTFGIVYSEVESLEDLVNKIQDSGILDKTMFTSSQIAEHFYGELQLEGETMDETIKRVYAAMQQLKNLKTDLNELTNDDNLDKKMMEISEKYKKLLSPESTDMDIFKNLAMSNPLDTLRQTLEESQAELDNIYQKQGESEEEFYARKLRVQQNYTNAAKNLTKSEVDMYVQATNAMMSVLNTFANMKENKLRDDVKKGKTTEKEAEAEFKKYKALQYATTWVSTLGAVAQIWSDASLGPWFVKAALSAQQLVAGIATCAQINRTEIGSADANGNSVVTPMISNAQVTPILDESTDITRMTNINTEPRNRRDERVYIVEQDIQDSGRKVEIRDKESTF
jgi:hypothetical protein